MTKRVLIFLFSLLVPGLGYLQTGNKRNSFITIFIFFTVIILGIVFRLFTIFRGLVGISVSLFAIYIFAAIHSAIRAKHTNLKIHNNGLLKLFFTISFILITGISLANRRIIMGFDIMSMSVPVMEPTVLKGGNFLIDTWAYKRNSLPKRGDIIVHSFNRQQGLYLNRIIAIGNDKVEIKSGTLFLNGQIYNEPYVLQTNAKSMQSKDMKAMIIPDGCYFVMGDNRDASFGDSRFSGLIKTRNITGKVTDIISSQDKSKIRTSLK